MDVQKKEERKFKFQLKEWLEKLGFKSTGKGDAVTALQLQAFCNSNHTRLNLAAGKQETDHIIRAIKHSYSISKTGIQKWTPGNKQKTYGDGSAFAQCPSKVILRKGLCDDDVDVTPPIEVRRADSMRQHDLQMRQQSQERMQAEYTDALANRAITKAMIEASVLLQFGDRFQQRTPANSNIQNRTSVPFAMEAARNVVASSSTTAAQVSAVPVAPAPSAMSNTASRSYVGKNAFDFHCSDDEAEDPEMNDAEQTDDEDEE